MRCLFSPPFGPFSNDKSASSYDYLGRCKTAELSAVLTAPSHASQSVAPSVSTHRRDETSLGVEVTTPLSSQNFLDRWYWVHMILVPQQPDTPLAGGSPCSSGK